MAGSSNEHGTTDQSELTPIHDEIQPTNNILLNPFESPVRLTRYYDFFRMDTCASILSGAVLVRAYISNLWFLHMSHSTFRSHKVLEIHVAVILLNLAESARLRAGGFSRGSSVVRQTGWGFAIDSDLSIRQLLV